MDNNNIRPTSPTPSTASVDSGIVVDRPNKGSAFNRSTSQVKPQLNQQNLDPAATRSTNIKDRASVGLTGSQRAKLGLLRLGAALLSGTRASHWLADQALNLLQQSYNDGQQAVVEKLEEMLDHEFIYLDDGQRETYRGIRQTFSNLEVLENWSEEQTPESSSFNQRMTELYEGERSHEALSEIEKHLFHGVTKKALEGAIVTMAAQEDIPASDIAGTFSHVIYDVVTDKDAATPLAKERLGQLKTMVESMKKLYPNAGNYQKTLDEIDKQMGSSSGIA